MGLDKPAYLQRARELVTKGGEHNLRYAALELRYCMEAMTYEKLRASTRHIPPAILEKWQPPQAVKALLEYEPEADKGFTLFAGVEEEYGKPSSNMRFVGEHKTLRLSWLRKHYNKVGGLLHVPIGGQAVASEGELAAYLEEVINDLSEAASGSILGGWFGEVHEFECGLCHQPVVAGAHRLKTSGHVTCLNPNCGAEYFGRLNENGNATFHPKVSEFNCGKCGAKIPIENRKLDIGLMFTCPACGRRHRIVNRQWGYQLLEEKSEG